VALHPDRFGNLFSVWPFHVIAALMAHWCGWTHDQTMRAPLGTVLAVFDLRIRDEDEG
jgi:hypothetical protein